MKIIIEKQFDKLGNEYLDATKVEAGVWKSGEDIVLEVEDKLYVIPIVALWGFMHQPGIPGDPLI